MPGHIPDVSAPRATVLHYIGYGDDHSGIVSVIRAVASEQRFECVLGVKPGFVQHRGDPLPALELPSINAETISPQTWWRARTVARMARDWLAGDPNRIIHGHSRAGLLVVLWLHRWGERRVLATVHSYGRHRWFYRWASRQLGHRLFWLTPAMKQYYGVGRPTWEGCLPNGLPVRPRREHRRPLEGDRLIVGGAGMIVRWKRWHLMLDALAAMPVEHRRRVEFRHAGAPDDSEESRAYARELQALAERLGVGEQVRWLGWQPAIESLLADVDCAIVCSRLEPFSMVALEALFAGIPVIAADEGGPRDFIVDGVNGWFFRSGDSRDLARVLTKLVTTDARRHVRISGTTLARFETPAVSEEWRRVYQRLLTEAAVGPPG